MLGFGRKKALVNLALLLFSLLVCVLLLEGIVRVLAAQQNTNVLCVYEGHEILGWKLAPNMSLEYTDPSGGEYVTLVETNSRGERGPEIGVEEGDFLVVGLGDSFAFGSGVKEEEVYLRVLEKMLGEKGKGVKALNTGVGNYNTKQELDTLELYLEEFDVDLVVLGFFTGNDVYGNLEDHTKYDVEENCLRPRPGKAEESGSFVAGARNFLRANFKSYGFFAEKIRAVPVLREALMATGLMQGKRAPLYILPLEKEPNQATMLAWVETGKQFERAQEIAERHGITIVVLDIPSNFQVYDEIRENALAAYGISPEGFEFDYPEKRLREFTEGKENLVLVETLEELKQAGGKLYYSRDPHWTPQGHEIAAGILERELVERKLV